MKLLCSHTVPTSHSSIFNWFSLNVPTGEYIGYEIPQVQNMLEGDALMHLVHRTMELDRVPLDEGYSDIDMALARYRDTALPGSTVTYYISICAVKIGETLVYAGTISTDSGLRCLERFFGYDGNPLAFQDMRGWYLGAPELHSGKMDPSFSNFIKAVPLENIKVLPTNDGVGDPDWWIPLVGEADAVAKLDEVSNFIKSRLPNYSDANLDKSELITKRGLVLGVCDDSLRAVLQYAHKYKLLPIGEINSYHMSNRATKKFLDKCGLIK